MSGQWPSFSMSHNRFFITTSKDHSPVPVWSSITSFNDVFSHINWHRNCHWFKIQYVTRWKYSIGIYISNGLFVCHQTTVCQFYRKDCQWVQHVVKTCQLQLLWRTFWDISLAIGVAFSRLESVASKPRLITSVRLLITTQNTSEQVYGYVSHLPPSVTCHILSFYGIADGNCSTCVGMDIHLTFIETCQRSRA